MRLWHYKLIPALPNKMLVSQWRECIAIKRQWEKGTLKHRLVSYVMGNKSCFYNYVEMIKDEMFKRNINFNIDLFYEIFNFCKNDIPDLNVGYAYPEHNDKYLKQCYYNLQEKADRGIITKEEWQRIKEEMND